jgi:tRNA threonylcarbamoyladenosine biosynthesis protein TsaB
VLALVDARKGEVFAAVHDTSLSPVWGPEHLPRTEVARLVELVTIHRAFVVSEMILDGLRVDLRGDAADLPDAASMATLASARLTSVSDAVQRFDAASLEALYVRAPDAKPLSEQR